MTKNNYAVGVDVGGTFTDIFVLDQSTGAVEITKVPSTLDDQSRGLVEGISRKVDDFSEITSIIHGTTTGTNALLERKGAVAGIITTEGFKDVLEMRRRDRPNTWGCGGSLNQLYAVIAVWKLQNVPMQMALWFRLSIRKMSKLRRKY